MKFVHLFVCQLRQAVVPQFVTRNALVCVTDNPKSSPSFLCDALLSFLSACTPSCCLCFFWLFFGFNTGPPCVGFVVGKVILGQGFFSQYFGFLLSISFHQCSIPIFIFILLFSEGQAGEALEPSNKALLFQAGFKNLKCQRMCLLLFPTVT